MKLSAILIALVLLSNCATLEYSPEQAGTNTTPNQYGWNDSNCRLIMPDGHCAQRIGFETNSLDPLPTPTPNQQGWDTSNCAHIMANGQCAHPTGPNLQNPFNQ